MAIQIKYATKENIEEIRNLSVQLFKKESSYDTQLETNWPHTEDAYNYFLKSINMFNHCALVAIEDGVVVGYLTGLIWAFREYRPVKTAEIDNILVSDKKRGKKIGKQLMDKFKEWCKENEVYDIVVMAYKKNSKALKFYKREGFNDFSVMLNQKL